MELFRAPRAGSEWFIRTSSIGLPTDVTVRIAGAGLAGLVAATTAARAGEDVDVYEIKRHLLPSTGAHTEALRNYESVDSVEELRSFGFKIRPFAEVHCAPGQSGCTGGLPCHPARGRLPLHLQWVLYRSRLWPCTWARREGVRNPLGPRGSGKEPLGRQDPWDGLLRTRSHCHRGPSSVSPSG